MNSVLYGYSVSPATWLYLSALLIVGVYFRFNRLWSRRNLDLVLLLALSPGLLLIRSEAATEKFRPDNPPAVGRPVDAVVDGSAGDDVARGELTVRPPSRVPGGYGLLMAVSGLILIRVLLDPFSRWRPRYEQNMNPAGMLWLGCCTLIFMGTRAIIDQMPSSTQRTVERAEQLTHRETAAAFDPTVAPLDLETGPAAPLVAAPVEMVFEHLAAPILAICAHLAVVIGLLFVGRKVFDDFSSGVAMVALYLLLPCTAFDVAEVNHVLPAAFLLWAVALYHRPMASGSLLALACGTLAFPVFLLPIWASFYGRRGCKPFVAGFLLTATILIASFALTSESVQQFVEQTTGTFRWYRAILQQPVIEATAGSATVDAAGPAAAFWSPASYWEPYRLPVIVVFAILVLVMTVWPRPKTLELLLAQQTATVIAVQFWLPDYACSYVLWYLPSLLILLFRPRLPRSFTSGSAAAETERRTQPASEMTRTGLSRSGGPVTKLR